MVQTLDASFTAYSLLTCLRQTPPPNSAPVCYPCKFLSFAGSREIQLTFLSASPTTPVSSCIHSASNKLSDAQPASKLATSTSWTRCGCRFADVSVVLILSLQCFEAANAVITSMVDELAPSGFMRYAPDSMWSNSKCSFCADNGNRSLHI